MRTCWPSIVDTWSSAVSMRTATVTCICEQALLPSLVRQSYALREEVNHYRYRERNEKGSTSQRNVSLPVKDAAGV